MRGAAILAALTMGITGCGTAGAVAGGDRAGVAGSSLTGTATAGAHSAGERLFPGLGNGGYDARSYDVGFDYRPGTTKMAARATMTAIATQDLSSFSLDSAVGAIRTVTVNGSPAKFRTPAKQEKLIVTPDHALPAGFPFRVTVAYTADRSKDPVSPAYDIPPGYKWPVRSWVNTKDGFAFMGQPDRAHLFFPSNDVPSDKARFTFRVTTPDGFQAVSNGTRIGHRAVGGGRQEFTYRTREPISTDIAQVAVGRFRTVTQRGPGGLPVRSYIAAPEYSAATRKLVSRTPGQIAWLEKTLGLRYPFESYGVLGVDSPYDGVALETATLSTYSAIGFQKLTTKQEEPTMVHELTHQYFGDAVSVRKWDDMWLSEGHASYYQMRYSEHRGWSTQTGDMHSSYEAAKQDWPRTGPPARLKYAAGVQYDTNAPGALVLFGLRHKVGDREFGAIERTFFQTYRDRSASTQDYIDIANRISGRNLTPYFRSWLYGKTIPAVPGHPKW